MKRLSDATVAIVGLGLMGGSLALALRKRELCKEILAVAPEHQIRERVLRTGVVDRAGPDLSLISEADLIILATPVRVILHQLGLMDGLAKEGTIILDLGSTKKEIVSQMERLGPQIQPIGGHPMCGKESSGFEAADADLFQGSVFALTPLKRTTPEALASVEELVRAIGARPEILEPAQHDQIVATVSHLPYLLAVSLVRTALTLEKEQNLVFTLAASGFRDASRLAGSDTTMMLDILATNRGDITRQVRLFADHLNGLARFVEQGHERLLRQMIEPAAEKQRELFTRSTE